MKFIFTLFALSIVSFLSGQSWEEKFLSVDSDLYQKDKAFQEKWKGREYVRGNGIKQFNRWKNFWEPRLFPSGEFSNKSINVNDFLFNQANKSNNYGNWESVGLDTWSSGSYGPGNGRVNCVYKDQLNSDVLYVGSASGGLWKSINQGESWSPLTDNLPSLGVSGIAVDYTNSNIIYIATGDSEHQDVYGVGVLKSSNGGLSWATTALSWEVTDSRTCVKLLMHPLDPLVLFCATNIGLYKTVNGGLSWESVVSGFIFDIEFKPNDPTIVYCTKERLYKSDDGGDNFSLVVHDALPSVNSVTLAKIAVTPANPEVIYLLCADNFSGLNGLYKSSDNAISWVLQSNSPNILSGSSTGSNVGGQAWYDMAIAVADDDEDVVIVGGINLWKSTNSGLNWSLNSYWYYEPGMSVNYVHADIHHLSFIDGELFCGSDGGIFVSENNADTFEDISSGLVISQFTRIGVSKQNSNLLLAGAQDNGTNMLSGNNWFHVQGADGGECMIHPNDSTIMFCTTQNGGLRKSTNGGVDFSNTASGIAEGGPWVTPFLFSPLNSDFMYTSLQNVWRSTDLGDSWTKISDINEPLTSLMIGMNDPNTIYTASMDNIYRTTNGGSDWEDISVGLPNVAITGIAVDPLNLNSVWVSFSGYLSCCKVFYSDNGGGDWTNVSENLPNFPVNCILFDDQGQNGIYIGTDNGVYYKNDQLANWEPFMNGLPNVIVSELEIHNEDQLIFAATFGRGVWKSSVWEVEESPIVDFSYFPMAICEGMNVEFQDLSSLAEPEWNWSFEGADVSTSDLQNPVISYSNSGTYDVTLTLNNEIGTSTLTCENCVYVYSSQDQNLPFQESFDADEVLLNLQWFSDNSEGWGITSQASFSGTNSMWVNNYQLNSDESYEVYSRPIFIDADQAFLYFKYSYSKVVDNNNEKLRLYVSTNCGETWSLKTVWSGSSDMETSAVSALSYFPQNNNDWRQGFYELSDNLMGEEVMFKFSFENDYGNNFFLDNINITSEEVSVFENVNNSNIFVYPNPVDNRLNISLANDKSVIFKIYNVLGQQIDDFILTENASISVVDYSEGIYFFSVMKNKERIKTGMFQVIH